MYNLQATNKLQDGGTPLHTVTSLGSACKLAAPLEPVTFHQQPEVNYLPRFSPQLISLEYRSLRLQYSREIDLLENLDIVHITLLVVAASYPVATQARRAGHSVSVEPPWR